MVEEYQLWVFLTGLNQWAGLWTPRHAHMIFSHYINRHDNTFPFGQTVSSLRLLALLLAKIMVEEYQLWVFLTGLNQWAGLWTPRHAHKIFSHYINRHDNTFPFGQTVSSLRLLALLFAKIMVEEYQLWVFQFWRPVGINEQAGLCTPRHAHKIFSYYIVRHDNTFPFGQTVSSLRLLALLFAKIMVEEYLLWVFQLKTSWNQWAGRSMYT
jgi:hypothetical protein